MTEAIITLCCAIFAATAIYAAVEHSQFEPVSCEAVAQAETFTMREFYTCL